MLRPTDMAAVVLIALPGLCVPCWGQEKIRDSHAADVETRSVFNGIDLSGWEPIGKQAKEDWSPEKGGIVCRGKGHTWLRSPEEYGNFNLRLEYRLSPGANSGVYVRVPADGNHHRENASLPPAGFEVQIIDDHAPVFAKLKGYQYSASVYDIAAASPRVSKPAGTWNTLEINCSGQHVTIIHNGVRVVDADPERYPLLKLRKAKGYLGLQSHNGTARFRNVRLGPPSPSIGGGARRQDVLAPGRVDHPQP